MDKVCAITLPLIVLLGGPLVSSYINLVTISNWPLLIFIVIISNSILAVKVMLSDYVKKFEIDSHCVQLTEMALTAFIATLAIQLFNNKNILDVPVLPYPFLHVLMAGLAITVLTTAIAAIIVKKIKSQEWSDNIGILTIGYLVGLTGYSLYVALFLLKVITK